MNAALIDDIDALLPQTQCRRCGYADCKEYAGAIASGRAAINQCPPGGQDGIVRLARLLKVDAIPLDPAFGIEGPPTTAVIDENRCIGCTLCIQACPVDAIVGSAKRMHTVLTQHCSGCDLCLAPCPVDCIDMIGLQTLAARGDVQASRALALSGDARAAVFRRRYAEHKRRTQRQRETREQRLKNRGGVNMGRTPRASDAATSSRKAATIAAALRRARIRRGAAT